MSQSSLVALLKKYRGSGVVLPGGHIITAAELLKMLTDTFTEGAA